MKKAAVCALVVVIGLFLAAVVFAESATKEECIAKAKEAAQLVNEKGLEAAIAEINRKDGRFVWKNSYVVLMDLDGKILAHPTRPELIGRDMSGVKDGRGIMYFMEFIRLAKGEGEGWVNYWMPTPSGAVSKNSFIYRVPGKDLLTAAGI